MKKAYMKKSNLYRSWFFIFSSLLILTACSDASLEEETNSKIVAETLEVTVKVISPTEVAIEWTPIEEVEIYSLERKSVSDTTFSTIATFKVGPSGSVPTSYTDKNLKEGESYVYRLVVVVESKVVVSKEAEVTPEPVEAVPGTPAEPTEAPVPGEPSTPVLLDVDLATLNWMYASEEPTQATNALGAALTVAGQSYTAGISQAATHYGNSEVMYALNGDCATFSAKVGLDDATTSQNPVVFQLFANGVNVWESVAMRAGDAALETGVVNIAGATRLLLLARSDVEETVSAEATEDAVPQDDLPMYANWLEGKLACESQPTPASEAFIKGSWGEVFDWQGLVATHLSNLPDGRVLSWSSWDKTKQGGSKDDYKENTTGYIWNPVDNSFVEMNNPEHDMFCAGLAMLPNGDLVAAGGGNETNLYKTSVFEVANGKYQWRAGPQTNRDHWYGTAVAMPNGSVFLTMGSDKAWNSTEVLANPTSPSGTWDMLDTANTNALLPTMGGERADIPQPDDPSSSDYEVKNWYPYLNVAPNGKLFSSGPTPRLYEFDLAGEGDVTQVGSRNDKMRTWGTYVMYNEGKILVSGGSVIRGEGATNTAVTINLTEGGLEVQPAPSMASDRAFHNAVMLPTGEALMVGGNVTGAQFTSEAAVYESEAWYPATNMWRTLAAGARPRAYHSTAILLPDGRVLAAGGGLCGTNGCAPGVDQPNGEVYSPPYLFNADGSLAARPVITAAPTIVGYNQAFSVSVQGSDVQAFSFIKLSSTTHGINTDLRYLDVPFVKGEGPSYTLTSHMNENVLTPGYYFLFAIDSKGVPSVAKTVQVR
ncbi:MAG: galactose oxidase-like domain-containing protein [Trueperaceae bacterium]